MTYIMSREGQKMQSAYKLVCGENPSKNLVDIKDKKQIIKAIENAKKLSSESAIKTAHNNTIEKSAAVLKKIMESLD